MKASEKKKLRKVLSEIKEVSSIPLMVSSPARYEQVKALFDEAESIISDSKDKGGDQGKEVEDV